MDAMISLQVSSSEVIAKDLNNFLRGKGYTTWICMEMDGGETYRESIVVNASGSKTMIALMNIRWAESKECRYEFNIATRSHLTKGFPQIIPVILEPFDFNKYPLITGTMANTNAIFYNPAHPTETWNKVLLALDSYVKPEGVRLTETITTIIQTEPLPLNIPEWKITHVIQWLQSLEFPAPKDAFTNNWVDGQMLLDLTMEEMMDSMKLTGLQAKRMMRAIVDLKNNIANKSLPAVHRSPLARVAGTMAKVGGSISSHVVSAVPSKLNLLKSKSGFITGLWEGYYEYETGKRDNMAMDITMIAGLIAGYGTDPVGDFIVQGSYEDVLLTCSFDKAYTGKHTVLYKGTLEGGKTIKGKWEIDDYATTGKFHLTNKKSK